LVENLPSSAASGLRERGHDWKTTDYLAAEIADSVRLLAGMVAKAMGANVDMPARIERPGDAELQAEEEARLRAAHDEIRSKLLPHRREGVKRGA